MPVQGLHPLRGHSFMSDSLASQIETRAAGAVSVSVDGQTVTERSLTELIEADRYLASRNAIAGDRAGGLRFGQYTPPGPLGGHQS
jgi:hypothetical protein